jgi:hypothetical protein
MGRQPARYKSRRIRPLRVVGVTTIGADKPQRSAPEHPCLNDIANGAPQQSDPDQIVYEIKET